MTDVAAAIAGVVALLVSGLLAWWLARGGHRVAGDVSRLRLVSSWWTVPISAGLAAAAGWWLPAAVAVAVVVMIVTGVMVSWIDVDVHRIPNRILLIWAPVQAISLLWATWVVGDWWLLLHCLLGAVVFGGVFLLLALSATMGMGDVKLAAICGGLLGFVGWPGAVLQAMVIGSVLGAVIAVVVRRRQGPGSWMPYGPAIVAGTLVAVAFS